MKNEKVRFETERERSDVQQQQMFDVAFQHTALNGSAHGHCFVRVHAFVRILFKFVVFFLLFSSNCVVEIKEFLLCRTIL